MKKTLGKKASVQNGTLVAFGKTVAVMQTAVC